MKVRWILLYCFLLFPLQAYQNLLKLQSEIEWDSQESFCYQRISLNNEEYSMVLAMPLYPWEPEALNFGVQTGPLILGPLKYRGLFRQLLRQKGILRHSQSLKTGITLEHNSRNALNQGIALQGETLGGFIQQRQEDLNSGLFWNPKYFSVALHYRYLFKNTGATMNDSWYESPESAAGEMLHLALNSKTIPFGLGLFCLGSFSYFSAPGVSLGMTGNWHFSHINLDLAGNFNSYSYRNLRGLRIDERAILQGKFTFSYAKALETYIQVKQSWLKENLMETRDIRTGFKGRFNSWLNISLHYETTLNHQWMAVKQEFMASDTWGNRNQGTLYTQYDISHNKGALKLVQNWNIHQWGIRYLQESPEYWDYLFWKLTTAKWQWKTQLNGMFSTVECSLTLFF